MYKTFECLFLDKIIFAKSDDGCYDTFHQAIYILFHRLILRMEVPTASYYLIDSSCICSQLFERLFVCHLEICHYIYVTSRRNCDKSKTAWDSLMSGVLHSSTKLVSISKIIIVSSPMNLYTMKILSKFLNSFCGCNYGAMLLD